MALAEQFVAGFLAIWAVLTILCQVQCELQDEIRRRDTFAMIPRWHFFAPTPGMHDLVLLFRDIELGGRAGVWREAYASRRTAPIPLCWVWNPRRRHNKALLDVTKELFTMVNQGADERVLELSVPYLVLLNYIAGLPRLELPAFSQFVLAAVRSEADPGDVEILFVSAAHEVESTPAIPGGMSATQLQSFYANAASLAQVWSLDV